MELSKVTSASQARIWPKHFTQLVESAPENTVTAELGTMSNFSDFPTDRELAGPFRRLCVLTVVL